MNAIEYQKHDYKSYRLYQDKKNRVAYLNKKLTKNGYATSKSSNCFYVKVGNNANVDGITLMMLPAISNKKMDFLDIFACGHEEYFLDEIEENENQDIYLVAFTIKSEYEEKTVLIGYQKENQEYLWNFRLTWSNLNKSPKLDYYYSTKEMPNMIQLAIHWSNTPLKNGVHHLGGFLS